MPLCVSCQKEASVERNIIHTHYKNQARVVRMEISSTSNANHIEKLVGRENYATWKFAMEAYLQSEDLWGCVTGEDTYLSDAKKMTKARAKIILSVEKQNYSHLQNTRTPQEAWQKLKDTFEDTGLT